MQHSIIDRGYYTVARRYEFYVRVANTISHFVRYCVCHENIKFISSSQRVMFFLLYGDKISEIAHFYSLLVASVEKFFENLQIVQGLLFCVFVVEAFGKLFHLFIV